MIHVFNTLVGIMTRKIYDFVSIGTRITPCGEGGLLVLKELVMEMPCIDLASLELKN
jgi:hypothetical protein